MFTEEKLYSNYTPPQDYNKDVVVINITLFHPNKKQTKYNFNR